MVTLEDISIEVGCSVNTVSKALNNKPDVSQAMRNRVLEAAKRLGYVPNILAKSLVTKTTGTIGIIVPSVLDPLYTALVEPIATVASQRNYSTFLATSNHSAEKEAQAVENFCKKRVDGLIVVPMSARPEYHEALERFKVPVVYLLNDIEDPGSYFMGIDLKECAAPAVARLAEEGRTRLLLVLSEDTGREPAARLARGFRSALERHRLPFSERSVVVMREDGEISSRLREFDGAALESDVLFWEFYTRALKAGLDCPRDLAIAACVGSARPALARQPLLPDHFSLERLAGEAFSFLMDLVENPDGRADARKILLRPH